MRKKAKPNSDPFDGYTPTLKLLEKEWLAILEEMPQVSAFGDSPDSALSELKIAWELMKESYVAHGEEVPVAPSRKTYSGSFNVRVGETLHQKLAIEASRNGISMNSFVAKAIEAYLSQKDQRKDIFSSIKEAFSQHSIIVMDSASPIPNLAKTTDKDKTILVLDQVASAIDKVRKSQKPALGKVGKSRKQQPQQDERRP